MKRDLPYLVAFAPGDFRASQSSRDLDLDAAAVHTHSAGHRLPHGPTMADALLELHADVLRNELCVEFRLPDLCDVDLHDAGRVFLPNLVVEDIRQLVDTLTASTDDRAGSCGEDVDLHSVCRALDLDSRDVSKAHATLDELECGGPATERRVALLVVVPVAIEATNDSNAKSYWVNFLAHYSVSAPFSSAPSAWAVVFFLIGRSFRSFPAPQELRFP